MESQIDEAISTSNYFALSNIFRTSSPAWQSLGQGEQRTLSSCFIKAAVQSPTFLPKAFASQDVISVMKMTLGHLPPVVEKAMDNQLRQMLFQYLVDELRHEGWIFL